MSLFRRTRAEDRTLTRESVPTFFSDTVAGSTINTTTAMQLPDVYACVQRLAAGASLCPIKVFRKNSHGRTEFEGKVAQLLEAPAPATGQANFVAQLTASLVLHGESFIGKYRQHASGPITQLSAISPQYIAKVELVAGEPRYTLTHRDSGRQTVHDRSDILHIRGGLSFDGLRGVSPIRQCAEALGLADALQKQASALASNAAVPRGVLVVSPGPAQEDTMRNLEAAWADRHKGPANAGRVAVLAADAVDFKPLSVTPADAEFLGQRKLSSTEIARLFLVPPYLIGAEAGSTMTYSNTESEGLNFLRFSLAPHLTVIEQALSNDTDLCPGNLYVEFLTDAILRTDSATRAQVYTAALNAQTGWLRRDEVRELENLPPEAEEPQPHTALPPPVVVNGSGQGSLAAS